MFTFHFSDIWHKKKHLNVRSEIEKIASQGNLVAIGTASGHVRLIDTNAFQGWLNFSLLTCFLLEYFLNFIFEKC